MAFILITIPLFIIFGILNLITGVSNDAVNFLGSAIGSGVTRQRNLFFIASTGILLGAFISAGMMEATQNEFIHPEIFSINELLSVLMASMIINILLIDTYNHLKFPVSTTIAVFFELIGGTLAVVLLKNISSTSGSVLVTDVINPDKIFFVLSGIVLSVLISFFIGLTGQFITRLIFTFNYKNRRKILLSVLGGAAITAISFLILKKSFYGSFIDDTIWHGLLSEHLPEILITIFAGSTFVFFFLSLTLDFDISGPVVLFGTFALALSFTANDLVNFIGIPIAGLNYIGDHVKTAFPSSPEFFSKISMTGKTIQFGIYTVSALIMALTLFFSKKSKGVIDTEMMLMSQKAENERFREFPMSVHIAEIALRFKHLLIKSLPAGFIHFIKKQYRKNELDISVAETDNIYFDNLRAIVNLTLAGLLISLGTYFKFPLSTTFVVFMTGIGTTIADNGWTEKNTVNRVAGVIYIMGGWFLSAVIAFAGSFLLTMIIFFGNTIVLIPLTLLLFYRLYKTTFTHYHREVEDNDLEKQKINGSEIRTSFFDDNIRKIILESSKLYYLSVNIFLEEDKKAASGVFKDAKRLLENTEQLKTELLESFIETAGAKINKQNILIQAFDHITEILKNVVFIAETLKGGLSKKGNRLIKPQKSEMHNLAEDVSTYFNYLVHINKEKRFNLIPELIEKQQMILSYIEDLRTAQIKRTKNRTGSTKASLLVIEFLANTKTLLLFSVNFINTYRKI